MIEMRLKFTAIALILLVGAGMICAQAQSTDGQAIAQSGVQSSVSSTAAALAASAPASGTTTASGTTASGTTGTYEEGYKQGILQGLKMGFTMQSLLDIAQMQYNVTAAEEYNSRITEFNQVVSETFGSEATSDMYLQPLNITALQSASAAQQAAAQQTASATAQQSQVQQTGTGVVSVGSVPAQQYIPAPLNPMSFTYNWPVHQIDGSQKAQAYFTQNGAGQFQNQPEGIKEAFSGKDPDSLGSI